MVNLVVANNDLGGSILKDAVHENIILSFPGADTYVDGTILARKQVADAIVAAADAGNTGDGTVTAVAVVAGDVIPLVGAYVLTITTAIADGGVWKLEDPNGNLIADNLVMEVGAGLTTTFVEGGMQFTITDGGVDFLAADFFTLTVAIDGKTVLYAVDGVGGAQVPSMVLTYEAVATGADDQAQRAMVSGQVRREALVIDAGDTVTDRIVDELRDLGIIALTVAELNIQDNQ